MVYGRIAGRSREEEGDGLRWFGDYGGVDGQQDGANEGDKGDDGPWQGEDDEDGMSRRESVAAKATVVVARQ
ncbi:hypothetical protein L1987_24042 [Smallanthus sonchifolius]|uniref:Uncharacterized protein n=1 Tax=Smallanthus sonchifolius TaxID=185202 RepID=A0ACB9IJJ9_9ASTR|nr:hypothetical protein L1987_24042 [Smallanthus sonchifolius]